ncbi:MAG: Hsp70 family protein [Anaerolineae bacterium]|nr:Hsp70 family protein [Anaerolineae bacterium]MDQ7034289.1 Hsp70 family protein [Anaerolineae bacterium]
MRIGLDFGTTNSSAALYHNQTVQFMTSSITESNGILPSLLYVTREHEHIVGRKAAERYLADDTGRRAVWETKEAGVLEYWVTLASDPNPVMVQHEIFVQEDIMAKGRLLQSIKTALRNPGYAGTAIFERQYPIQKLITLLLEQLYQATEITMGKPIQSVLMGRPVTFTGHPKGDERSEAILLQAAQAAGFAQVDFMAEPIAAAYSYHRQLNTSKLALIFDFGGGTLDLTVARLGGEEKPHVLSSHGVLVGGDNFDRRIMEKFLLAHFGENALCEGRSLSYQIFEQLLDWPRHPELTRGDLYTDIKYAAHFCHDESEFRALLSLIDNKYGFKLFKEIEHTKMQLSEKDNHQFTFKGTDINIQAMLTRRRFGRSIRDYCAEIDEAIGAVLEKAALSEKEIDVVIRTGGSSQVPTVVDILTKRFGDNKVESYDAFLSVASGLAIAAASMDENGTR